MPTRGRGARVLPTVRALLEQRPVSPDEIVVVDQSPTDETRTALLESGLLEAPRVRYIPQNDVSGASRARNFGFRESRGSIVAFIDDDCVPPADWASRISQLFVARDIDLVFGRVAQGAMAGDGWIPTYEPARSGPVSGSNPSIYDFGLSANMAARRSALVGLSGPFEPEITCGEDTLVGYEAFFKGYRVYISREISVDHYGLRNGADLIKLRRNYTRAVGQVYMTQLRRGHARQAAHLLGEVANNTVKAILSLLRTGRPSGATAVKWIIQGAVANLRLYSLDPTTQALVPARSAE